MGSLRAALDTKRTIDEWSEEPGNIKQRTANDGDLADAEVIPTPRRFIQARNGTVEMQEAHRRGCSNDSVLRPSRSMAC